MVSKEAFALIMFNATLTAIANIDDKTYKHNAKNWLKLWRKQGNKLWTEIKLDTTHFPEAFETYEELGAMVYEIAEQKLNEITND